MAEIPKPETVEIPVIEPGERIGEGVGVRAGQPFDDQMDGPSENPLVDRLAQLQHDALEDVHHWAEEKVRVDLLKRQIADRLATSVRVAESAGVGREDLAKAAGVSESTIGSWVRPEKD